MQGSDLAAFALALGVAAFIPGPGMTSLLTRTITSGKMMGMAVLAGMILGDIVYLSFAVFGLSLLTQHFAFLFVLIKYLATGYLFWLAWCFWQTQPSTLRIENSLRKRDLGSGLITGFLVTIANPKTITFYLALVPLVLDLSQLNLRHWGFGLLPTTSLVLAFVGSVYIFGALWARRWLVSTRSQKYIYRSAAVAMVLAGISILIKE